MESLGTVGIVDKGEYNPESTYYKGNFVLHEGSSWLALKDNLVGVTPEEGENWKYLARGYAAELLSLITAIDSQGLLGDKGAEVASQSLVDKLSDMVANQIVKKAMMSGVQVNDTNMVPTSALVYSMQQAITKNAEGLSRLDSELDPNIRFLTEDFDETTFEYTVLDYISTNIPNSSFILYCKHSAVSLLIGFLVAEGTHGCVIRMDYNKIFAAGRSGEDWSEWKQLY